MFEELKNYCKKIVPLNEQELALINDHFGVLHLKRKSFLHQENSVCDFVAYIVSGTIRHFHTKDGDEKTCDISFDQAWVTDFASFNQPNARQNEFAGHGRHNGFTWFERKIWPHFT